jgi:hypothetical protein
VEHVVTFGLEHRVPGQIDAIGVDEIQYAKGHKYLTLVYQIDLDVTRLLWVGRERTIESFRDFSPLFGITTRPHGQFLDDWCRQVAAFPQAHCNSASC